MKMFSATKCKWLNLIVVEAGSVPVTLPNSAAVQTHTCSTFVHLLSGLNLKGVQNRLPADVKLVKNEF